MKKKVIKLGKTKDSRIRKKKVAKDVDHELWQRLENEKEQPSFINYLLKKGYSLQSSERYEKDIACFKKWLAKEHIEDLAVSYNDITYYIGSKKGKVKQLTLQKYVGSLKHYYKYLQEVGLVKENPVDHIAIKGVKRRILHNILSKQELEKVYFAYKGKAEECESLSKKRNAIMLSLVIYQGLNTSELQRLTIQDIKLREGKIFIGGSRRSNERVLELASHQILELMEYQLKTREKLLEITNKETDLYFISQGSSYKLGNTMHKLMQALHKENKEVKSIRQLRASVITFWLKQYNLREVQYLAGHRYVSSTEGYLVNDLEGLQEAMVKYHPIQ